MSKEEILANNVQKMEMLANFQTSGAYAFFSSFSTVHESRIKRGSKKFTEEPSVSLYENKVFSNTILSALYIILFAGVL